MTYFMKKFPRLCPRKHGRSPLDVFRELNGHEIAEIAQAVSGALEAILIEKVAQLRESCKAAKKKEMRINCNIPRSTQHITTQYNP